MVNNIPIYSYIVLYNISSHTVAELTWVNLGRALMNEFCKTFRSALLFKQYCLQPFGGVGTQVMMTLKRLFFLASVQAKLPSFWDEILFPFHVIKFQVIYLLSVICQRVMGNKIQCNNTVAYNFWRDNIKYFQGWSRFSLKGAIQACWKKLISALDN